MKRILVALLVCVLAGSVFAGTVTQTANTNVQKNLPRIVFYDKINNAVSDMVLTDLPAIITELNARDTEISNIVLVIFCDDVTAAGTVQAEQLTSTDDATVADTLGVSNVTASGTVQAEQITSTDDITATGTVQGEQLTSTDDGTIADSLGVGTNVTIASKYATVGPDASTALQVDHVTFTNGQAYVSFTAAFASAPSVVCGWSDDVSGIVDTNAAIAATSVTATNFVPATAIGVGSATNAYAIAIGSR